MTKDQSTPAASLAELVASTVAAIDRELAEIEMLANQVRSEAARHEQRRAAAADKLAAASSDPATSGLAESFSQLVTLTKRATMMEAQGDLLEAKHKALARHRASLISVAELVGDIKPAAVAPPAVPVPPALAPAAEGTMSPSLSRVVLAAQEDLRREIARAMHDGPAQSLTNIVLQTQIVERLIDRDAAQARSELRVLAQMVQQTLDTTKNFIFDVRPMVLDDLGLVPTLRRSTRDRGRRVHVRVEFESNGPERRLPMELESTLFRMLDEGLTAYLAQAPDRAALAMEWTSAELQATLSARRTPQYPEGEQLPPMPEGDVPDTIRRMIADRHEAQAAARVAAEEAAYLPLPAGVRRNLLQRAAAIGGSVEVADIGDIRIRVALPEADSEPR